MIKKIALALIMFSSTVYANDPVVVWDLHGVVLMRSGTVRTIIQYPHITKLFQNLSWPLIQKFLASAWDAFFNRASSETFVRLGEQYDNPYLSDLTVRISNAQLPMPGVQGVIESLEEEGIQQYVGSNIGATAFADLLDEERNPTIAPLIAKLNPKKSQVVEDGKPLMKPDPAFFKAFLRRNCFNPKKRPIIFIDDREENIRAAEEEGLIGIRFRNAQQLQKRLAQEGIEIPVPDDGMTHFEAYRNFFE